MDVREKTILFYERLPKNEKEVFIMILFIILALTLLLLIAFVVIGFCIFGSVAIVIFGDVIVCAVLIVLIIKWLCTRKKK